MHAYIYTHSSHHLGLFKPTHPPPPPPPSSKRLACALLSRNEFDTSWALGVVAMVTQHDSFDFMPQHLPAIAQALLSLLSRALDAAAAAPLPPQTLQLFALQDSMSGYCFDFKTDFLF